MNIDCQIAVLTTVIGNTFSAGFIVGKLRGITNAEYACLGHRVATNFLKEERRAVL